MIFVDTPDKIQKHPHYEHRTEKLDRKDNEFSSKKFHQVRKVSTNKNLIKSFGRIGMRLNNKSTSDIPRYDLAKVCFVLINSYENDDNSLGVGPLNDGYLVALKHHRLGFKVFYLYNPRSEDFSRFLEFFMKNTQTALTVFYSGRGSNGSEGIEFNESSLSKNSIRQIISLNCSDNLNVIFITDCLGGGSVFDIRQKNEDMPKNLISFSVTRSGEPDSKESKRSHGIFTYYFCKITSECPNITPNRLVERMNPSLNRFNEVFSCQASNKELLDSPIYF